MQQSGISQDGVDYVATPTVSRFMLDDHFVRWLLGPVGSGKTTGALMEVMRRATAQAPAPDGIRHTRFVVVRNTLAQIKQTVLKDVETWFGPIAYFKSSDNVIQVRSGDVESDWYLIPLDEPLNQQRLLSLQLTGAWINEFIEIDVDLIDSIAGRVGRYPFPAMGGCTWSGIIGDSNMPNAGSRWHERLDIERPVDWGVFIQPGGFDPAAENLDYLTQTTDSLRYPPGHAVRQEAGREYYRRLARNGSGNWLKRYVHAQYGDDPDGTAVFRETFNRDFHVSTTPLEPSDGHLLTIGQDFGRNPCALVCQMSHRGQLLVLEEIVADNVGLEIHTQQNLKPKLLGDPRYLGKRAVIVGDPAGVAKNQMNELTCFEYLEGQGFAAFPAPTNEIDPRLRAVEAMLGQNIGGKPMLLVDGTRCPKTVQALHTKYLFGTTKQGQMKPAPAKTHPWSDLMDCLQYVCLCAAGPYAGLLLRHLDRRARVRATRLDGMGGAVVAARRQRARGWT